MREFGRSGQEVSDERAKGKEIQMLGKSIYYLEFEQWFLKRLSNEQNLRS